MTEVASNAENPPPAAPGGDPRPAFLQALALAGETLAAVRADQLGDPTPCGDYDVRTLANHLVAVLRRVAVIGGGGDPFSVPGVADDVADGERPAAWDTAVRDVETVWSDPAVLSRPMQLPFGTLPGAVATIVYTTEFTLHTWDLATATGQQPRWDPAVLAVPLATMQRAVPAEPRGGPVPFGPVVDVPADAPDIDRLVAWYGRQP
jgi:uncharacterized protein (TIGR03086 family)